MEGGRWKANVGDMKPGETRELPGLPEEMAATFAELNRGPRGRPGPGGRGGRGGCGGERGGRGGRGDYQETIKQGDFLLNRIQKLSRTAARRRCGRGMLFCGFTVEIMAMMTRATRSGVGMMVQDNKNPLKQLISAISRQDLGSRTSKKSRFQISVVNIGTEILNDIGRDFAEIFISDLVLCHSLTLTPEFGPGVTPGARLTLVVCLCVVAGKDSGIPKGHRSKFLPQQNPYPIAVHLAIYLPRLRCATSITVRPDTKSAIPVRVKGGAEDRCFVAGLRKGSWRS
nr:UDP-glycosyltransferase 73C7-like [Tanacetum cinerariifolium]